MTFLVKRLTLFRLYSQICSDGVGGSITLQVEAIVYGFVSELYLLSSLFLCSVLCEHLFLCRCVWNEKERERDLNGGGVGSTRQREREGEWERGGKDRQKVKFSVRDREIDKKIDREKQKEWETYQVC